MTWRRSTPPLASAKMPDPRAAARETALAGGLLLGLGLGGFIDGIVLHQILQWHNICSGLLPPTTMEAMARNMRWDGLFHLATLALTLAGVLALYGDSRRGTAPPRCACYWDR